MGIFSDRCQALIDPVTKKALTGNALEEARLDPKWPRCENKVKKAAKFCGICGTGAPGGWTKCPSCGKWVGNESYYCWNCKTALHPEDRLAMAEGWWQRAPGLLAQRLDVPDIKQFLKHFMDMGKIQIQAGTAALVLEGGKFKDILDPGSHTLESLRRKINNWGDPPPRSVVLIDSGILGLSLRFEKLRTSENIEVDLYLEIMLQFINTDDAARSFLTNVMRDQRQLEYDKFTSLLVSEIRYAAENNCTKSTIEELFKDPDRRLHLDDEIQSALKQTEAQYGFKILRVSVAEFTGKEYEELLKNLGELDLKRRKLEFDRDLRQMVSKDEMSRFKTEHDLEEYVAQLGQERDIGAEDRKQELDLLKQGYRHEIEKDDIEYRMAREIEKSAHDIGIKLEWDDYTRDKLLKDKKLQDEMASIDHEREVKETEDWIGIRKKKDEAAREDLAEKAKLYKDLDIKSLISIIPDEGRREQLMEMFQEKQKEGKSVEEILALEAARSPEAAKALAEMAHRSREDLEREFKERKKLSDENADRLERVLTKALETTGEAAKRPGNTYVK